MIQHVTIVLVDLSVLMAKITLNVPMEHILTPTVIFVKNVMQITFALTAFKLHVKMD